MNSQFYYRSALAEGTKGNLNAALSNFDKAIALEPDNSLFYFERGNLYLAIRNYNKAIQDYFQSIYINPNYADVYFNLGYAHTDLHEHEKAIDFFSKAINIKPNLAEAYVSRAINYSVHGNYLSALDDANTGEKLAVAQGNFLTIKNAREIKQKITNSIDETNELSKILPGFSITKAQEQDNIKNANNNHSNIIITNLELSISIDCSGLRDLLAEQKWEEADILTQNIIYEIVKKQQPSLFVRDTDLWDEEDDLYDISDNLEKLPCEDLIIIDNLWVKYSNNHFGFSVQKEILDKLGGIPEHNKFSRFEEFGRWVGWMSQPNNAGLRFFRAHQELYYPSVSAPRGHLPVKYCQLEEIDFFAIMKRLTQCKISG